MFCFYVKSWPWSSWKEAKGHFSYFNLESSYLNGFQLYIICLKSMWHPCVCLCLTCGLGRIWYPLTLVAPVGIWHCGGGKAHKNNANSGCNTGRHEASLVLRCECYQMCVFMSEDRTELWLLAEMIFVMSGSHSTRSASEPTAIRPLRGYRLKILAALVLVTATNWFSSILPVTWDKSESELNRRQSLFFFFFFNLVFSLPFIFLQV